MAEEDTATTNEAPSPPMTTNAKFVCFLVAICGFILTISIKQQSLIFDTLDGANFKLADLYNAPLFETLTTSTRSEDRSSSIISSRPNPRFPNALEKRKMTQKDTNTEVKEKGNEGSTLKQQQEVQKPLNILLLYADDWRFDTLGAAGNKVVKTPVLDQMANEGIRFTENCVTTSICWVSRATLYTGMYLARHKFEMLGAGRTLNGTKMGWEMPKNETIYALLKHHAGYHVGHAGKLGLWLDIDNSKHMDYFVNEDGWHYSERQGKMWHITEKNTHDAMKFLKRRPRQKPFFLNVGYFATHAVDGNPAQYMPQADSMTMYANDTIPIPLTATEEAWKKMPHFFGRYNEGRTRWRWRFDAPTKHQSMMKNYYRMASEVDTSVGTILKELETQGVLNETLIIFTTDNGNFHAEHGLADKWYPHQESIKVPLIIKDPRMDSDYVGTINEDFTLNIDLAPTIVKAAGLEPLSTMMGRDMSDLYRKPETIAEGRYLHERQRRYLEQPPNEFHTGSHSEWRNEFFYHHPMHTSKEFIPASEALVRKDYKYMYWPNFDYEELFDLRKDPGEVNDLLVTNVTNTTSEVKEVLEEMRKRFQELKGWAHRDEEAIIL